MRGVITRLGDDGSADRLNLLLESAAIAAAAVPGPEFRLRAGDQVFVSIQGRVDCQFWGSHLPSWREDGRSPDSAEKAGYGTVEVQALVSLDSKPSANNIVLPANDPLPLAHRVLVTPVGDTIPVAAPSIVRIGATLPMA